jgi:hypothetical protein
MFKRNRLLAAAAVVGALAVAGPVVSANAAPMPSVHASVSGFHGYGYGHGHANPWGNGYGQGNGNPWGNGYGHGNGNPWGNGYGQGNGNPWSHGYGHGGYGNPFPDGSVGGSAGFGLGAAGSLPGLGVNAALGAGLS